MRTRVTQMLDIEYPIIQASMAWITDAGLAAAVSQAGGLGTIGPNSGSKTVTTDVLETGERLREQIRRTKSMTSRPFAVNFVIGVGGLDREFSDRCVEVGIEEQVPVAIVSQGSPMVYTQRLKDAGMKVLHVCSTVRHAEKAEEEGVDGIITGGTEGGGHSGFAQLTTLCLVPQVVDAVSIPVIAGGGIGDARGLIAALSLGAEAVYMGTRFLATKECPAHPNVKRAILEATDTSTIAVRHGSPFPERSGQRGDRGFVEERRGSIRLMINEHIKKILEEKAKELTYDDAFQSPSASHPNPESNRTVSCFVWGEVEENPITASQISGMIQDIPSCQDLVERIVRESKSILERFMLLSRSLEE